MMPSKELHHDIQWAKCYYDLYIGLCENTRPSMNSAPHFWSCAKSALLEAAILRLCRIFDEGSFSILPKNEKVMVSKLIKFRNNFICHRAKSKGRKPEFILSHKEIKDLLDKAFEIFHRKSDFGLAEKAIGHEDYKQVIEYFDVEYKRRSNDVEYRRKIRSVP